MTKEFELLKKLVALANNNPNDNEANSAARRVCKMLAEHEFSFIQIQRQTHPFDDLFSGKYESNFWSNIHKTNTAYDRAYEDEQRRREKADEERYKREQDRREREYYKEQTKQKHKGFHYEPRNDTYICLVCKTVTASFIFQIFPCCPKCKQPVE